MGSGFDDWVYWHFFTITVNYKSSHIELLNDVSLKNLSLISHCFECTNELAFITAREPNRGHRLQGFHCYGNLVFSNLLPGSGGPIMCYLENIFTEALANDVRSSSTVSAFYRYVTIYIIISLYNKIV
jgi:hypothetical protein